MKDNKSIVRVEFDPQRVVSLKDFPEYKANPFIEPIVAMKVKNKTVQIATTPQMALNENGAYVGDSYMVVKKKVDKEEFVKVFKNQLTLIFEFSKTAQKVLTYFIKNLGVNKDIVIFDIERAKIDSSLSSKTSIYFGLAELIQNNIIARSNLNQVYFINPAILFNGDRLVVVNEWLRDDKLGQSLPGNAENWPNEQKQLPESNEHAD
jgi:hypothetical protein